MDTTNPVNTAVPTPGKSDALIIVAVIAGLATIVSGGYWALTNRVNAACQSIWIQAANPHVCGQVLTWHPISGVAAILGILILAVTLIAAHGNWR